MPFLFVKRLLLLYLLREPTHCVTPPRPQASLATAMATAGRNQDTRKAASRPEVAAARADQAAKRAAAVPAATAAAAGATNEGKALGGKQ